MADTDLDQARLAFEKERFAAEMALKSKELELRQLQGKAGGLTPAQATVGGAMIALASAALTALITGSSNESIAEENAAATLQVEQTRVEGELALERSRQEAALILSAIDTETREAAVQNLRFFVAAGFISDPDGRIANLDDSELPWRNAPDMDDLKAALDATMDFSYSDGVFHCTAVAIDARHIVTAGFCQNEETEEPTPEAQIHTITGDFDVILLDEVAEGALAVYQTADGSTPFLSALDWASTRTAIPGETVYLAFLRGHAESTQTTICALEEDVLADGRLLHTCDTPPGSAGALMIAVSDNAPIAIDVAELADGTGVAYPLVEARSELLSILRNGRE